MPSGLRALLGFAFALAAAPAAAASLCVFVSSYAPGYSWSDGIEQALAHSLRNSCRLERFYLDSRRRPDPEGIAARAREIHQNITALKPDVVIAADDNASRYLVMPYLRNTPIPVVFCGINWSVAEYGYPYPNATGMVEVISIPQIYREVRRLVATPRRGLFVSADTPTQHKNYRHYRQRAQEEDIELTARFVTTFEDWQQAYRDGQDYDFLVLDNNRGIRDWDAQAAAGFALEHARVLSVAHNDWMMDYAMVGVVKFPEEQGRWAARLAREILAGASPDTLPIIPNQQWELWINPRLLERAGIRIPEAVRLRANRR